MGNLTGRTSTEAMYTYIHINTDGDLKNTQMHIVHSFICSTSFGLFKNGLPLPFHAVPYRTL